MTVLSGSTTPLAVCVTVTETEVCPAGIVKGDVSVEKFTPFTAVPPMMQLTLSAFVVSPVRVMVKTPVSPAVSVAVASVATMLTNTGSSS